MVLKFLPMQRLWRASILITTLAFAFPAAAHPVPFSYLDLQLQPGSIDVGLTVHIYDLAHDLQVSPMERLLEPAYLAERESAIRALFSPRLELRADGRLQAPQWLRHEILEERQSVRFHLRYPTASIPGVISVLTVMFPYDSNHQTFVNVYESDTLTSQVILDRNHTR